jgi:hypothetical protein
MGKKNKENGHGISCNCARCVGLRLYPIPSLCDWCGTTHAGNAANCPDVGATVHSGFGAVDFAREPNSPQVDWIISLVERCLKDIKRQIMEELKMGMKDMLDKRGGNGAALLSGSDIPPRIKSLKITVAEIREAPEGFTAPAIIDLKTEVYGKTAWAVNKTNMKALIKHFGDDEKKMRGKTIKLDVISVRNPSSGDIVPSLAVSPRQ